MPRDDANLLDILKAARLAIEFKEPAAKEAFLTDAKTQSAVLHQLLVIGEAVKRLSPEFREAHPEVPCYLLPEPATNSSTFMRESTWRRSGKW